MTRLKKRGVLFLLVPVLFAIFWVILQSIFGMDPADALDEAIVPALSMYVIFGPLGLYNIFRKEPSVLSTDQLKKKKKMIIGLAIGIPVLILLLLMLDNAVGIF